MLKDDDACTANRKTSYFRKHCPLWNRNTEEERDKYVEDNFTDWHRLVREKYDGVEPEYGQLTEKALREELKQGEKFETYLTVSYDEEEYKE